MTWNDSYLKDLQIIVHRIKTGGREAGTPNEITSDLREKISGFLNQNWEQVEKDFQNLEPEKRVLLFEKLLSFTVPKMKTISKPDLKQPPHKIEYVNVSNQFTDGLPDEKGTIKLVFKDFSKENNN